MDTNPELRSLNDPDRDRYRETAIANRLQLYRQIVEELSSSDVEFVEPIFGREVPSSLDILHSRLGVIQALDSVSPSQISLTLLEGVQNKYPGSKKMRKVKSIDGVISDQKHPILQLDRLNELGLDVVQQLFLSRAVMIAAHSRIMNDDKYSGTTQAKLFNRAKANLAHFATNRIKLPDLDASDDVIEDFGKRYSTAYLAAAILRESRIRGIEYKDTSIENALGIPIPFSTLHSSDEFDVLSVFALGDSKQTEERRQGFRQVEITELDEQRIDDLRKLATSFGGPNNSIHVFETIIPFKGSTIRVSPPGEPNISPEAGDDRKPEDGEDDEKGETGYYTVILIRHMDDNGIRYSHVIADNPEEDNACYALRQEVSDFWRDVIGINLPWEIMFKYKRLIARQLGARPFYHRKQTDHTEKVEKYLREETDAMVHETFARIFDQDRGYFTKKMKPTSKNRMPKYVLDAIANSEFLKQMWPAIVENGFVDAMILRTSVENEEKSRRKDAETAKVISAQDILASLIRSNIRD